MADLQSIIKIIFSGEDQLSGTVRNASSQISDLGDIAETVASPFASLANAILLVDAALVGVATVIGVQAVQASSKFGTSLSDLNRFLSESEGSADDNRVAFQNLSLEYGTNINDVVASTADWKAANFDLATSLELTQTALDYSIAGQISAGEATDLLKRIIAGMAVEQDKAAASSIRFGDVINAIADSSSVNFKELAIAVAGVAPSIAQTGGSFEQITAILAVMTDVTQSGSQSQAAFSVIMGQLQAPTKAAAAALSEFGIEVDKNGITQTSFIETLRTLATKWPELTTAEKSAYAQRLVSAEQLTEFNAIMNGWGKSVEYNTVAVEKATGSMASEVARSLDTAEKAFEKFGGSLDLLFISLGDQIQPGVVGVTNSLKDLIVELGYLAEGADSPLDPLFDAFGGLSQEIARVIDAITENLDDALATVDFSGLLNAFSGLFGELDNLFTAFFGDLDITTVEGLSAALQKIVDVGQYLVTTTQGIISAFEPFADAAGRAVEEFTKLDSASQLDFGRFIGSAKLLVDAGIGVGSVLIAIGNSGLDMADVMSRVFGGITAAANAVQLSFDGLSLIVTGTAITMAEAMRSFYNAIGDDAAVADIDQALVGLNETFNNTTKSIETNKNEFENGLNKALNGTSTETQSLRDQLSRTGESLRNAGQSARQSADGIGVVGVELGKLAAIEVKPIELAGSFPTAEIAEANGQLTRLGETSGQLVPRIVSVRDANGQVIRSYTEMSNVIPGVTGTLSFVSTAYSENAEKAEEAKKKSDEYLIKMEEIASNERIKTIEAVISLNVAQLETDMERVKAAFASIDNTVSSTSDLLGGLFGSLTDADFHARNIIENQIQLENKRRQDALDLQRKLAEAEIERINAQTAALDRGVSMIEIDGKGLQPQLEAFMFEILKQIRVKLTGSYSDFLLALAAPA